MKFVIGLLILCNSIQPLFGQVPEPFSKHQIMSYPRDLGGMFKSPIYWQKKDWGRTLIAGAVIYGAFTLDKDIANYVVDRPNNSFSTGFLARSRHWGDGLYSLPTFAAIYFWGRYREDGQHQLVAMNATKAFVLSRVIVQLPKYLFQRASPANQESPQPHVFHGPFGGGNNRSFPSGHVISVFSAAEVFRLSYDDWWVGVLSYSIASTVAMQRMGSGSHWFSDVTASAILGTAIGHWITKKGQTNMSLVTSHVPDVNTQTVGLLWRF